jgi:hypothetical protein
MSHDDLDGVDDLDDGLPPHLRALLHDGSAGPALSRGAQERVLGRVIASVGAVALTSTAAAASAASATATTAATTATTATTATATVGMGLLAKSAIVVGFLGVAGLVGVGVVSSRPSTGPVREPVPVTASVAVPAVLPVLDAVVEADTVLQPDMPTTAPLTTTTAPLTSTAKPSRPMSKPAQPVSWEAPQLESARAALSAGEAQTALSLIEDHARRAPNGAMREERDALQVLALVRLDRHEEAQAAATAFFARYPTSLFGPRVQGAMRTVRER